MELEALDVAHRRALEFLRALPERRVGPSATVAELRERLGGPLPEKPMDAAQVVEELADASEAGLMGTPSPRFFGFVIGGSVPAAIGADWLASAWDQNSGLYAAAPAAAVVEEVACSWLIELLGLPADTSVGFVTGGQMANFTGLAAARHEVLRRAGWDVERDGLQGAPRLRVIGSEERHVTVDVSLRYLGIGTSAVRGVPADAQGRMRLDAFAEALAESDDPTIVLTQAGNVNTGSFDPIGEISDLAHERGAWVHVDGAFGLWAAAAPAHKHLIAGFERADSWATDAHKWLNVPYDSGLIFCANSQAHRAAMSAHASYLIHSETERDQLDWVPEFSRRARGFAVYAALRSLGREGIAEMVERCCACARRFADRLSAHEGVEVLNDVVLNQVLVRFTSRDGDSRPHDAFTAAVVNNVQQDGTCWLSGSTWHGMGVMRISVSNWQTTFDDVDRSVDAILQAARDA